MWSRDRWDAVHLVFLAAEQVDDWRTVWRCRLIQAYLQDRQEGRRDWYEYGRVWRPKK